MPGASAQHGRLTRGSTAATLGAVNPRLGPVALASALLLAACSGGAASSSSLQAQTAAAANPSPTPSSSDVSLSEPMLEAQLLCTTALSYRPCGLVPAGDTVSCFLLCQAQIAAGATNLMLRGAVDCAARPPEADDAGSPACELQLADDSPVEVTRLREGCNARCRELRSDGGVTAVR